MVGKFGQCYFDYSFASFWKNIKYEHDRTVFSIDYARRGELFEGLSIWKEEKYRKLQGTIPVISLSFADIKETTFSQARKALCYNIKKLYNKYDFLLEGEYLNASEKESYQKISAEMENYLVTDSLRALSDYLGRYYGKKPIILLDEYDTPMQEAYVNGYWTDIVEFMRSLFNATFKTNPYFDRAIMTGITRVSKESIFSDLNNLEVVTTTSDKYAEAFGFTQKEVSEALREYGISELEPQVKDWYDGFTFGTRTEIYNSWSIINFLDKQKLSTYWANTSSNSLVGKLIREGSKDVKIIMENLLNGEALHTRIDEQIVFNQLDNNEYAIWSLLLASGYLKVERYEIDPDTGDIEYDLKLTNKEVRIMFRNMIEGWFKTYMPEYNDFIKALLDGDLDAMNEYMNSVALSAFSNFDTGKNVSNKSQPERLASCCDHMGAANGLSLCQSTNLQSEASASRFYHGFALELMVELSDRYTITSNRESGFGRYDVMLEPKTPKDDAIIIEFKVHRLSKEKDLEDTVKAALAQIEEKQYAAV